MKKRFYLFVSVFLLIFLMSFSTTNVKGLGVGIYGYDTDVITVGSIINQPIENTNYNYEMNDSYYTTELDHFEVDYETLSAKEYIASQYYYEFFNESNDVRESENNADDLFFRNYNTSGTDYDGMYWTDYTTDWTAVFGGGGTKIEIASMVGNHDTVLKLYDPSSSIRPYIYSNLAETTTEGIIQFWIRLEDIHDCLWFEMLGSVNWYFYFRENGHYGYYYAGYHDIATYSADTWYHIEIDFDTTVGYDLYIDGVFIQSIISGTSVNPFTQILIETDQPTTGTAYLDALGFVWYDEYDLDDNVEPDYTIDTYDFYTDIDISSFDGFEYGNLFLNMEFDINDTSFDTNLQLYNYDTDEYDEIYNLKNELDYLELLQTKYIDDDNTLDVKITTLESIEIDFDVFKVYYSDNFTHTYKTLYTCIFQYDIASPSALFCSNLKSKIEVTMIFNSTCLENIIVEKSEYIYPAGFLASAVIVNYDSIAEGMDISSIEYDIHFLSLLTNTRIRIYVICNQDSRYIFTYDTLETNTAKPYFILQSAKSSKLVESEYNSYYNTFPNIKLMRFLYCTNAEWFVNIPFITDITEIQQPPTPPTPPVEPAPPNPTGTYWLFEAVYLHFDTYEPIIVGNWTFDYPLITITSETTKYPYDIDTIAYIPYGVWYDVVVNAIKLLANTIIFIVNMVILFFQFVGYLLTLAWNYIVLFLVVGLLGILIWNIVIKYLLYAIVGLVWLIYVALLYLYQQVLIPIVVWLLEVGLPALLQAVIWLASAVIALLIWLFTLCQANLAEIFETVNTLLSMIAEQLIEVITIFIVYLPYFIIWIFLYLTLCFMLYVKYLYYRFRGFNLDAKELYDVLMTFLAPFRFVLNLYARLRGSKSNE